MGPEGLTLSHFLVRPRLTGLLVRPSSTAKEEGGRRGQRQGQKQERPLAQRRNRRVTHPLHERAYMIATDLDTLQLEHVAQQCSKVIVAAFGDPTQARLDTGPSMG
jgi:hypothetical protein